MFLLPFGLIDKKLICYFINHKSNLVSLEDCMLWKTHIKIAFEVFRSLGIPLSEAEKERLREGVIAPDKWGLSDTPHHYGKEKQIHYYLLESRKYFLRYDLLGAYYYLGVALHYIQDSYVSMASFYPKHHSWETSIDKCNYESNLEKTIRYWLKHDNFERERCLRLATSLANEIQGKDSTLNIATLTGHEQFTSYAKPIIDYNLGFRASYIITKSVLGPRSSPQLNLALKQSFAHHQTLLREREQLASNEIVGMVNQMENLKGKKVTNSGITPKLKNAILSLRLKVKELQTNSKYNSYLQKKHLLKIASKYNKDIDGIMNSQLGWYIFSRSKLDMNIVKSELVPVQNSFRDFITSGRIRSYNIRGKNIVLRRELNEVWLNFES
jgi:hypothetical protein